MQVPAKILLVEDNPGDQRLTLEALREAGWVGRTQVAQDGQEALELLKSGKVQSYESRPNLIILDLNLPKVDGREVLAEIKGDPELRKIPVVVLSSSGARSDILDSYELNANCYITKPADLNEYYEMMRSLEQFWCHVVRLPQK